MPAARGRRRPRPVRHRGDFGGSGRYRPARRRSRPHVRRFQPRSHPLLHRHLRHLVAGAPGCAAVQSSGPGAQPATLPGARLRKHEYGRVAGQLQRLLRPGNLQRLRARARSLPGGLRHPPRRSRRLARDRELVPCGRRGQRASRQPHRLPRAYLSGHARYVLGFHHGQRANRRPHRGAGDVRSPQVRGVGDRRRGLCRAPPRRRDVHTRGLRRRGTALGRPRRRRARPHGRRISTSTASPTTIAAWTATSTSASAPASFSATRCSPPAAYRPAAKAT